MTTIYLSLVLISAATLAFQMALTRFFSLAQGHHFAFMAISLALLGFGASGSYLSLRQPTEATWRRTFSGSTLLFTLSVPAAYLVTNYIPFDAYRIAWEPVQLFWLVLYYLALTVPFLFSGLVIGVGLAVKPDQAGPIYAANLLGSGVGPPLALAALDVAGGPGTVFACTLLGWLAVVVSGFRVQGSGFRVQSSGFRVQSSEFGVQGSGFGVRGMGFGVWAQGLTFAAVTLALLYLTFSPPALFQAQLTPYKSLTQAKHYPGSQVIFSEWNAISRVDVLQSEGIRSAPGLSFAYTGQIPPQLGLTIDGDNLSPITGPAPPAFTQHLPLALSFKLRPNADTLILEPGGGLAVLTALQNGAKSVTVVQSNPTVVDVVSRRFANFNGNLYNKPNVTVIVDDPRSFLRRTRQEFDLIILPLTDSFRPVTAGAYTLSEDYRYTVEAFADALDHLSADGLLVAERWLQLPPSESLRLWGTMIEGLQQHARRDPQQPTIRPREHLLAIRSLQTSLVAAARSPLSAQDLSQTRAFATSRQFDLVWLPNIQPEEVNRYSVVPNASYHRTFANLLAAASPSKFYANYAHAIAPPTDDHPFFFHFFKWQQIPNILQSLGKTWQPFGGSGYLVLVILLILVVVLSAWLILLPLLWQKSRAGKPATPPGSALLRVRYLFYFTLLGLGFLFVEVPLLQRFILFLGQPAYAFAVVVSALLVAAGIGSGYLSKRVPLRVALPLITLLAVAYPLLLPHLFDATLRLPFAGRVGITVLAVLPLGMVLGVPFPRGMVLVGQKTPQLTPWVWGVNGCASVVSAVLAPMIALTWGFSAVVWSAALSYGLAALVLRE